MQFMYFDGENIADTQTSVTFQPTLAHMILLHNIIAEYSLGEAGEGGVLLVPWLGLGHGGVTGGGRAGDRPAPRPAPSPIPAPYRRCDLQ